ncbi:MAG: class I SAM-dependent methyltransferase [Sinobacteraceae bacterium]|nr:class I SAM-dependent methyltransferase [Nevskiaceae bacterium]
MASRANQAAYDALATIDYVVGAPHLRHESIRRLYLDLLGTALGPFLSRGRCPRVLDLGAGEGSATLPLLQMGAAVVAVDISARQLAALQARCAGFADRLTMRCEDISTVLAEDREEYDAVVANSLLHHIPDYLNLVEGVARIVREGGAFVSFQDPVWRPAMSRRDRWLSDGAYAIWRLGRGDVIGGLGRRLRRMRGRYSESSIHDNVEFHAVRQGVDQHAIVRLLNERGFRCRLQEYCSFHSDYLQRFGERWRVLNTFGLLAVRE